MSWYNVLNIDPGLATFGAVVMATDGTSTACRDVSVFTTEGRAKQWSWNMVDDLTRRGRELARNLEDYVVRWSPRLVFAERMGVFNAYKGLYTQIMNSIAWGVVVAEMQRRLLPLTIVAPTTWRKALTGPTSKMKGDAIEALAHKIAMHRYQSYEIREARIHPDHRPHARDALGVFAWADRSGLIRGATP